MNSELFQKSITTISEHIKNVSEEGELDAGATVRKFRTVQMEGSRDVENRNAFRKASGKPLPNWFLILQLIAVYPNIVAEDISKIIGISERTVYKYFNQLQENELVERVGGRKEGFLQIKKQCNSPKKNWKRPLPACLSRN